jgi:hypothetical protein
MQIHRYTRLTELESGLLELLDKNKIRMTAVVAVSYLQPEDQREVLRCVRENGAKLSVEKAGELRRLGGRLWGVRWLRGFWLVVLLRVSGNG